MPNVVLLVVDSLRGDHCSCYGYERETTPTIDALAAEGQRFEHAYSPSSHTREAVPAMLTGQYPHRAVDENFRLAQPTLATMLAETHTTGAFHSNPYLSRAYGFDRDFDTFDDDLYFGQHKLVALAQRFWDKLRNHHYARAETINDRALSWLDSLDDDDSFFLWAQYMDAHVPYEPPDPYRGRYADETVSDRQTQRLYDRMFDDEPLSDAERELLIDLYDAEIAYTDAMIGELLDGLEARGLREDTLVIVTSDHGDEFGECGNWGHPRQLSKPILSIPLVVAGPSIQPGTTDVPATLLDIVPTLTDFDGPGRDLRTLGTETGDRHVISETRCKPEGSGYRRYSVFSRDDELFFEQDSPEPQAQAVPGGTPLAETLRRHLASIEVATGEGDPEEYDEKLAERLEALGYK